MAVVQFTNEADAQQIPVLHYMAMHNAHPHTELAESVKLLL
jgi:hypothetical protein